MSDTLYVQRLIVARCGLPVAWTRAKEVPAPFGEISFLAVVYFVWDLDGAAPATSQVRSWALPTSAARLWWIWPLTVSR